MLPKYMYRHVGVIVTKKEDIVLMKEDKKRLGVYLLVKHLAPRMRPWV